MSIEPRFSLEPAYTHGQASRTAIVYCNLGTPDAPTAPALRRYLAEFLSDPRVVEIPRFLWLLILHGIILRVRPAKSAQKYASIWTDEGFWRRQKAFGYLIFRWPRNPARSRDAIHRRHDAHQRRASRDRGFSG